MITHIKQAAAAPSSSLEDWGKVGEPAPALRGEESREKPDIGVWECSPGRFRRQIRNAEFMHFVQGRARFHADPGQVIEFTAGDAVYLPRDTLGTWEVSKTLRKTYAIW